MTENELAAVVKNSSDREFVASITERTVLHRGTLCGGQRATHRATFRLSQLQTGL